LSLACRMAAEFGAHLVKTYYCENFEKVVTSCPVPVIIAGGPKLATELDVFNLTHDALHAGASGVDMGRNIWQNDHPVAMIKAVRAIVHQRATVKEAHELFKKIKSESPQTSQPAKKSKPKK
ncbi:MAG: 3-hydroxy-5-phosphonooxypentane-2,4-dione thiolase, partial [Nitrosotalea sp.]